MPKAVFLDRDGVINKLIYNHETGEYEPPHREKDLELYPWTVDSLKELIGLDYLLFLVSNQPDAAKGKTTMEALRKVHEALNRIFLENKIFFSEYYYCYHHPKGVVKEFSVECECRKPKPFFVLQAMEKYRIDAARSWFIGDRDSDVFCGQKAGVRTILVEEQHSKKNRGQSAPDFIAENLKEAVEIIYSNDKGGR